MSSILASTLLSEQSSSQTAPPPSTSAPAAAYKPRIRRKFPRTKLGCLTCRSRRKKCDERRPICQNCEKRKVACSWPALTEQKDEEANDNVSEKETLSNNQDRRTDERPTNHNLQSFTPTTTSIVPVSSRSSPSSTGSSSRPWYMQWSLPYNPHILQSSGSRLLFDRYLSQTCNAFSITPSSKNPFASYVLPLALSDELFMSCVLAASGADICYDETTDSHTKSVTWSHYSLVVRGLRNRLFNNTTEDVEDVLHILLLTMMLLMIEIMAATPVNLIFHHLLASRHLIHTILTSPTLLTAPSHLSLFGHLFELYSFRCLGSSIHPVTQLQTPISHSILDLHFFIGNFSSTPQYTFYSSIFAEQGHLLSAFLPEISTITSQPVTTKETHEHLSHRLRAWLPTPLSPEKTTSSILYQNALLLYLITLTSSHPLPTPEIQIRISICLPLLSSLYPSRLEGIVLWPSMIIGSCLTTEGEREVLRKAWGNARYKMRTVVWAQEMLEALWRRGKEEGGEDFWGPRGLAKVVEEEGR
ncbi:uncharacterized protein LY89DRAFT_720345 [Mollisia scopiformis]|uniref:Zn(2)-C6 fungal-type domain-containing protein n=1 Tax=Mollisia scopiformis TaxID=149040 RepID=A0A194X410_MOLSC|nr:uncharacterized protein LY89DRAFT_720345 [Mollisia scopiformis]KUJ14906.1 hypothetical protein LY89DRAFT_720345 [Mollisia scopiformis]